MTVSLAEFLDRCPDDVDILEYQGLTKPCVWRCVRCEQVYKHTPNRLQHNKVNCRCNGYSLGLSLTEHLKALDERGINVQPKVADVFRPGKKLTYVCLTCDTEFDAEPRLVQAGRHVCPGCKRQRFVDKYVDDLAEFYPNVTVEDFQGYRKRSWHKCECGSRWQSSPLVMNGRIRRAGCKYCNWKPGGPKLKTVEFGSRVLYVQGYEDTALEYLETRLNPELLMTCKEDGLPYIAYMFKRQERTYMPDFYYPPKEQIIEVKSIFTLMSVDYAKTVEKREACRNQGYKFKLILVHKDQVLRVPRNWYTLSRKELGAVLADRYPEFARFILKCSRSKRNVWRR